MKKIFLALLLLPLIAEAQIITTIAGNGTPGHVGDGGLATAAELNNPHGVCVDAAGNIYIADNYANFIRKINTVGTITTIAGTGSAGYTGDNGQATAATMNGPFAVAVDPAGNVFFSDFYNNVIRKINTLGIITTVAGNGTATFLGDGGPATAAELGGPSGISLDGAGNMYIGEFNSQRVRKVNTLGIISTIAGNGTAGWLADGVLATATELWNPNYVHATASGDVYISDNKNHRIRLVSAATGIITTVAGNGIGGSTGNGVPATDAELYFPGGVNFDAAGNMYIAGDVTENIRVVNTSGIITDYAGDGTLGFIDNADALMGELYTPVDVAFDAAGNLLIADQQNNRVRRVASCARVTAQPANDTIPEGAVAIYSVTSALASAIYQWQQDAGSGFADLADVLPYSGVTTNTLTISDVAAIFNASHYRCIISNESSCTDTSAAAILIIGDNASVMNINAAAKISIFPNPATTSLIIQLNTNLRSAAEGQITITNLLGQNLLSQNYNSPKVLMDVSTLPSGLYFVKVNGGEVRKFVKD